MKNKILLFCFPVLLLLSLQSFSQANYYVATNGNDANAGTLASPFLTLAKAVTKATVAGDTIFMRKGTYASSTTIKITKPGNKGKPIVLTVYKPDMVTADSRPVLDFSAMSVGSSNRGLQLSGCNYWHIYGIIVKGAGDNGINFDGTSYTTLEFCSSTRNRDAGIQLGGGSSFDSLINCDSYENADLGTGTTTSGGNADGFSPKLDVGDSIYLKACRSWTNSDDGYDGYLRPNNNMHWKLEDCWAFHNGYYWLDGSTTSSMNGQGFKTGGSDSKDLAHDCTLTRCLSFENKGHGFDQNSNAGTIAIYNCTSYNNSGNDYYMKSPSVSYVAGAQLILENDYSLGAAGVGLEANNVTAWPMDSTHCSFKTSTTSAEVLSFDTTGVTGIRAVDGSLPVLNFMHLKTTATPPFTYIDQGVKLPTLIYHGVAGLPYNGAAPDLGAFESAFGSGASYIFTGSGNWTTSSNWQGSTVPPASLPSGATISINGTGPCILNTTETISSGGTLTVQPGKQLTIPQNLTIAP